MFLLWKRLRKRWIISPVFYHLSQGLVFILPSQQLFLGEEELHGVRNLSVGFDDCMCNFYIVIRTAYAGNVWCLVSIDLEKNENLLQSDLQVHVCHIYWDKFRRFRNPNNCLFIDNMPSGTLIGMEHPRMTLQIYSRSPKVSGPSLWSLWPLPVDFVGDIGDETISWYWALLGVGAEMLSFGGWACPRGTSATLCNVWCTVIHRKFN